MTPEYPRLLVATEFPPNGGGGGPAIVRQMLKGWPIDKLFWWSCLPETGLPFGQQAAAHAVATIPGKLYPQRHWCAQKSWLLEHAWTPWATRHFRRTLARVQPEAVWVVPHAWVIPPLANFLPGGGVGFHVSIHDYMGIETYISRFGRPRCQRMERMAEQLYAAAATRDTIGQPMLDDLRAHTGAGGTVTRAGLEPEDFDYLGSPPEASPPDIIRSTLTALS